MKKYTYIFKDGKRTYTQTGINDWGLVKNIKLAEEKAKENKWELKAVTER